MKKAIYLLAIVSIFSSCQTESSKNSATGDGDVITDSSGTNPGNLQLQRTTQQKLCDQIDHVVATTNGKQITISYPKNEGKCDITLKGVNANGDDVGASLLIKPGETKHSFTSSVNADKIVMYCWGVQGGNQKETCKLTYK